MPTSTEIFINAELPKRPYTNQFPFTAGHVPVATGVGLQVEARTLTTSDISGMDSYATQEDLSDALADANEYADGLVVGLWDDRGAYTVNAAGNINYPSTGGSGVAGALMKGDIFTVTGAVAGISTINNIAVNNGDTVRALVDNPSATDNAHWAIAENNIGYVPENRANKTTNTDLSGASGTYPDTPTVKSYIDNYDISAASISSTGTVTLTRTASDLTFQVPTAISGLSFDANTGVLTSSYTNNATSTTITVAANEVSDNVFRIKDNDDATKKIAFEASGIATGETRTIIMPDSNVDLGNVAQAASTSTAGYLTNTDWSTFNSKQAALADTITAGTYGSASKIPQATYNAKGIVTGITEVDLVAGITPVAYTAGTAYTVGQVVSFQDNLYRVVTAHTASTTPNGNIDLIGDVCKVNVGSSFTAYRLSNLANPAANKTLEVWGSGTTFTLDLVNAPSKVIFRTTNAYNVTTLTISRAGSTFYYNKDATSVGSNSVSLNVVGGCTLEITVYTAEVLVHVVQQPTIQGFKLVNTATAGTANVGVSFSGSISADVVYTLANKAINFGDLPNVATTDSNNLSGTRNRILGGNSTTLSGTDNIAIGCSDNTNISASGRAVVILARRLSATYLTPHSLVLGTSAYDIDAFGGRWFAAAVKVQTALCTRVVIASGSTYSLTSDGENPTPTNSLPALLLSNTFMSARHEFDFIITFGKDGITIPSRTCFAKRTVYVVRRVTAEVYPDYTPVWDMSIATPQPDVTLGLGSSTVTIAFTLDSAANRLIPTISATSNPSFLDMQVSCRVDSHYNRK